MKKAKLLSAFLLALVLCVTLAACDNAASETKANDPIDSSTTEITTTDDFEFYDYVANTPLDQVVTEDSNFFGDDGVAYATLVRNVDGDTSVVTVNGQDITLRYLGVDTPESTGQVEEWGKTASKFTADKLNNAEKIVVQTNGGAATFDTTGSRYLSYVWYKPAGGEFRLLNLELVQEGLSYGKSGTATRYADVLVKAQNQAIHMGLRIFGDEKDPNYFYGDALETTIKYILENQDELTPLSTKVKFDCTITREDGYYVYAQDYDAETDEYYSILLYKGYNLHTAKLKAGYRVSVCGNVGIYNDCVQITGMQDISGSKSLDNLKVSAIGYEINILDVEPKDLDPSNTLLLRRIVSMDNLYVAYVYTTESGDSTGAMTLTCKYGDETVTVRTSILYDDNYNIITEDYFKGHTINVIGILEIYKNKYQIQLVNLQDCTIVK